jgi:uncharacterized membrane protein
MRTIIAVLLLVALLGTAHAGTGERIAEKLRGMGLSPEAVVVAVSMLPVAELRGALPIGINLFHLPLWKTLLLAIVGNMIPIFLVVLLLEKVVALLEHIKVFRRFFEWLFKRTRSKSGTIAKYEFWGLAIFVGIPLPGTGAWTGAVAAVAMDMPYWRSLLSIFLGVLMAAAAVTLLCLLGVWGAVIAGAALAVVLVQAIVAGLRRRHQARV